MTEFFVSEKSRKVLLDKIKLYQDKMWRRKEWFDCIRYGICPKCSNDLTISHKDYINMGDVDYYCSKCGYSGQTNIY
jgi:ribosomal protein S27AE